MTKKETGDDERETLALTIARTMDGWNDDTTEPEMGDPLMRRMAEEHWEKVNEECLRQGRKYADAILSAGYRKHSEPETTEARVFDVVWAYDNEPPELEATYRTRKAAQADIRRRLAALTTTIYFGGWEIHERRVPAGEGER